METVTITTRVCIVCGESSEMQISAHGYKAWKDGAYVQTAFPELAACEREMLISGTHPQCWDTLFAEEVE